MANWNEATIQEFKASLRGPLLSPGVDGYDAARAVWRTARAEHREAEA